MTTVTSIERPERPRRILATFLGFILAYFIARGILKVDALPPPVRIIAALLPIPVFTFWLWELIQGVRKMDELEQRIHLEALAVAFPLTLILLMSLGLLEIATSLPPEDFSYRHVWAFLPLFYVCGLALARNRYR